MTNQRKIWQHDSGGQHRKERILRSSKGERVNQLGAVAFNGVSAVNTVQFLEFRAHFPSQERPVSVSQFGDGFEPEELS